MYVARAFNFAGDGACAVKLTVIQEMKQPPPQQPQPPPQPLAPQQHSPQNHRPMMVRQSQVFQTILLSGCT